QIASLESQVITFAHHVEKLDRALAAESQEKQALSVSHSGLLDKYNALKKEAVKLEQFRKSIVNMIEYSSTSRVRNILDQSFNINGDLDIQEVLARAEEEAGVIRLRDIKRTMSEDEGAERGVDEDVDEEEDVNEDEDGEDEGKEKTAVGQDDDDDVEELNLDAGEDDEEEDEDEEDEMATLEQFEATDTGTPDLEVYYTLNRPRTNSITNLNPLSPTKGYAMHDDPSDLALLSKQALMLQRSPPRQQQNKFPTPSPTNQQQQPVITRRNSFDALGGSTTPLGSGRVRQIIAESKSKMEPHKRWTLQDAAKLAPAVGGGGGADESVQDTSSVVENRSLMNRLRRFSNQNLAGEALADQQRPYSSNAGRKLSHTTSPGSHDDLTRLPTHHEEQATLIVRSPSPTPIRSTSKSRTTSAPSGSMNAGIMMSRSASASAAFESKTVAYVERGGEQVERDRERYRERERDRDKDTDLSNLEGSFVELYKQIRVSLSEDDFRNFAEVVRAFNNSEKTAEETVFAVEVIVKSRDLFVRFRDLVGRALLEKEKAEAAAEVA
ncbi:hypothetical protein BC937DRAFT_95080, partial [Endogone sp. FLAS-F59071]